MYIHLGLTATPAIIQLLILPFSPESPRYLLLTKNQEEEAVEGMVNIFQFNRDLYDHLIFVLI